jgi:ATP-binding cassette subfamily F protein 3
LKALADKQIPGLAWNQRILLLGQTRELSVEEAVGGLSVKEETVLEHVIRSNAERERYTYEANRQFPQGNPY